VDVRAERRLVTCLFVDVVGSTDATVRLGPERMQRALDEAFTAMSATIAQHGGTIEKYAGDSVFALFGAPTAHGDDPERALRAADACARWSSTSTDRGARLAVRVGLETGEALVDLDAVERGQRMAVGQCVNIAARLQQEADPGQIVAGPTLHDAAATVAQFEPLGKRSLKGLGDVDAWRFIGFGTGAARPVGFVGREHELQVLSQAMERANRGTPTLALIIGPPGQGKSRLAAEAVRQYGRGPDGIRLLQARCRPGAEAGINTPLRQLVNADIPDASAKAVRRRLVELLGSDDGVRAAESISHSAGLAVDNRLLETSRIEQREIIAEAWRRYLVALARERTLVTWIEDLHWADPIVLRMIHHAASGDEGQVLVIGTARPEFVGSAHLRGPAFQIDLPPLDLDAAAELARQAGDGRAEVARAGGNPLFIIELARSQSAAGAMPMTIQAAIEARLDELSPAERDMLQRASVAGETFNVRDAALLGDLEPAEVAGMLGRVAHLGFVEPIAGSYRYHHALVRDVAYGRLPVAQRMALHARYAADGVDPEDVEARAHHWWGAVNPSDATWVWADAAKLAQLRHEAFRAHVAGGARMERRNAYEEAEQVYARAVDLADDAGDIAMAHAALGRAIARQGRGDEAWEHRLGALERFAAAGVPPTGEFYADMLETAAFNWGYFKELPDDDAVLRLLDDGERAARASGDDVSLARLLMERAAFTGRAEGLEEVERFLESEDPAPFAETAHRAAEVYLWNGRVAEAMELHATVFERLLPAGAAFNEPEAMVWYGLAAFNAGDLARMEELTQRLLAEALRRSAHTRQHAYGLEAVLLFGRGEWDRLADTTRRLTELVDAHPDSSFCLWGAGAAGYGAVVEILSGRPLPEGLDEFVARLVPASTLIQAGSVMLPKVMTGDEAALGAGLAGYVPGLRLRDRVRVWDRCDLMPAIALTMLERWDDLRPTLQRLDDFGRGGARLAEAAAAAVREEMAAANGGSRPTHADLRALGYKGISELLSFRPREQLEPAPAGMSSRTRDGE
jgi:class 3 adenylate cyclase/tetratricopeptide (TPR) repeat protein